MNIYEYRHNACNDQQFCGLKTCSRCRGSVVACPALLYSLSLLYMKLDHCFVFSAGNKYSYAYSYSILLVHCSQGPVA